MYLYYLKLVQIIIDLVWLNKLLFKHFRRFKRWVIKVTKILNENILKIDFLAAVVSVCPIDFFILKFLNITYIVSC